MSRKIFLSRAKAALTPQYKETEVGYQSFVESLANFSESFLQLKEQEQLQNGEDSAALMNGVAETKSLRNALHDHNYVVNEQMKYAIKNDQMESTPLASEKVQTSDKRNKKMFLLLATSPTVLSL